MSIKRQLGEVATDRDMAHRQLNEALQERDQIVQNSVSLQQQSYVLIFIFPLFNWLKIAQKSLQDNLISCKRLIYPFNVESTFRY